MMHQDLRPFLGYCKFSDTRGKFEGIVNRGCWEEVNLVHTQANCVRGGHFHRKTTEVIFLLTGKADVILTPCDNPEQQIKLSLTAGEGLWIEPMISHEFIYQEDSTHIQLLDQRFDPENQDLHTSL